MRRTEGCPAGSHDPDSGASVLVVGTTIYLELSHGPSEGGVLPG